MKRKNLSVRLYALLILLMLFISVTTFGQNVMTPSDSCYQYDPAAVPGSPANPFIPAPGIIAKWVNDTSQNPYHRPTFASQGFDQTTFKCYYVDGLAFRLRFPNNYDPANPAKYPLLLVLHGAGEPASSSFANNAGANRDNQAQLWDYAQYFEQLVNQGEWNGFLLYPQLINGPTWDDNSFPKINVILDTLQKYNGFDPDRVSVMGLSAGGHGSVNYASYYPKRIASVISSNPIAIETLMGPDNINSLLQIPIYMAAGGMDMYPPPAQVTQFRDSMASKGGNIYLGYYPLHGHDAWWAQWSQRDIYNRLLITAYWNNAHKAQPLLYYKNNQFCANTPISAKMGITAGFYAYEWQYNSGNGFTTINGAGSNTYTATQAGSYRVHFKHDASSDWSSWTPHPVVISTGACKADTAFAEHFETNPINNYVALSGGPVFMSSPYLKYNFNPCQNGIFTNGTEVFTQDATGRQGGTFMLNNTNPDSACSYFAGDQVWRTYNPVAVLPNTTYVLNFYTGNNSTGYISSPVNNPVAQIIPKINGVALTATPAKASQVGNISWKKFSYIWNSGSDQTAEIAITNNTTDGTGNDFVLDEISLVKYSASPMPAGVNASLWAKAGSVTAPDLSPVSLWTNNEINGNNLLQTTMGKEPLLKNNASDNINFNPVIAYTPVSNSFNFLNGGFSGNATHNAAHIYLVTKANSIAAGQTLVTEPQALGALGVTTGSNGTIIWNAGSALATPNNSNEPNKPIIWTFSKDNINGTGNSNKQDVRKNGLLAAASGSTSTLTGKNSNFYLGSADSLTGTLNGNIGEIIYLIDTTINAATENKIESYLAIKYGITLGYHEKPVSYTASDGRIVWPSDAKYQTDVFGIGSDSVSGLVQTRSNSANAGMGDGTGQPSKGNLVLSTVTNLSDKNFLMIGNDSAALTETVINSTSINPVANGSTRLTRTWKVSNTGGIGAVNLSFDTTGLGNLAGGNKAGNYALMIDTDGDGNFNNSTVSFFTATGSSGKKINFDAVTLNNNVVFTIITLKSAGLAALPAIWLGFTVENINGSALLQWKTGTEINVDRYVAEHSFDGSGFSAIGTVAANNLSVNQYTFTQNGLTPGTHYYRIRRVDKDGKFSYSDLKSLVVTNAIDNVQVEPNPVTGSVLRLTVSVIKSNKTIVQVMSAEGKVILQQNVSLVAGNNVVNLNIAKAPDGVYIVQMQLNKVPFSRKFIRQR